MKLSSGIDLIEIERVREAIERHSDKFVARIFTEREQRECGGRVASLAARFAAKEAAAKALGTGIGDVSWLEIEVGGDENNAPHLYLTGIAEQIAKEKGLVTWSVSLSHTHSHATALVIATGE
ncbi:MAG: holo-ACP synthase [Anaerolineales bacterium]